MGSLPLKDLGTFRFLDIVSDKNDNRTGKIPWSELNDKALKTLNMDASEKLLCEVEQNIIVPGRK